MATSLNDTSGTVGQTVLDVIEIIEHAVRRCGVSASIITSEQMKSARHNLFLILSNLATRGLSLWCVQRFTFGIQAGRMEYALPVGTIDTLKINYRNAIRYESTAAGAGVVSVGLAAAVTVSCVVVTPAAPGVYTFVLEASDDGATWIPVGGPTTVTYVDYAVGLDATVLRDSLYFRVRDTADATRALTSAVFMSNVADYLMSKMSRDDYSALPNKTSQSQWPLQFWYDKQFYQPRITLWPAPSQASVAQVFLQRQIQDPGAFTNAVEVPQRWLDAVISLLAPRVFLELPKELVDPARLDKLEAIADRALLSAEDSETDGAPIRLAPSIGCYTR
jgi:hypothetical protein